MESGSSLVREFDNLCSDVSRVAMDANAKSALLANVNGVLRLSVQSQGHAVCVNNSCHSCYDG